MTTFIFDLDGTVRNNASATDEQMDEILAALRIAGHRLVLFTARPLPDVPPDVMAMFDEARMKNINLDETLAEFAPAVYMDDNELMRNAVKRWAKLIDGCGCKMIVLSDDELWRLCAIGGVMNFGRIPAPPLPLEEMKGSPLTLDALEDGIKTLKSEKFWR